MAMGFLSFSLYFKYISPKERKELKSQRDKLFKEVEKLIKKENYLEVIEIFDKIATISEQLGDTAVADEIQERANTLRRHLGQEIKSEAVSWDKINSFIEQLMKGPFGEGQVVQISSVATPISPEGQITAQPKSLLEEGQEIIARLRKIKGEISSEEEVAPITTSSSAESTPTSPITNNVQGPAAPSPPMAPPAAPPKAAAPPPPMAPPAAPPKAAAPPPPMAPPTAPPKVAAPPSITVPTAEVIPTGISSSQPEANSAVTPSAEPMAFPVPDIPASDEIENIEIIEGVDATKSDSMSLFIGAEPEIQTEKKVDKEAIKKISKKDEKEEIKARLEKELPYLPEKLKKNIIKELLKRPAGKLRETWFQVYIHKNKKYASKN